MTTCEQIYGQGALECQTILSCDDKLQLCLNEVSKRPDWIMLIITVLVTAVIIIYSIYYLYNKGYVKFVKKPKTL